MAELTREETEVLRTVLRKRLIAMQRTAESPDAVQELERRVLRRAVPLLMAPDTAPTVVVQLTAEQSEVLRPLVSRKLEAMQATIDRPGATPQERRVLTHAAPILRSAAVKLGLWEGDE